MYVYNQVYIHVHVHVDDRVLLHECLEERFHVLCHLPPQSPRAGLSARCVWSSAESDRGSG